MNKWARKFVAGILAAAMILSVYTPGYVKVQRKKIWEQLPLT